MHLLRDTRYTFGLDDANGRMPQARDSFRAMLLAYPAAIFVIAPIDNVMTAVFDAPVATVDGKHALRVGMLRSSAGNAMDDFTHDVSLIDLIVDSVTHGFPINGQARYDVALVLVSAAETLPGLLSKAFGPPRDSQAAADLGFP